MKGLKYLFFLILIAVIAAAIYIAVQPNSFEVSRERIIDVPTKVVYNNVIDYKNWEAWSPWKEQEPNLKITYPELTKGVGGSYSWDSKKGVGNMKTISAIENKSIEQDIQFDDYTPSKVLWRFETTNDNKTKVIWKMKNDNIPFMLKGIAAISGGFEKMIGPDFERGLEKLDSITSEEIKQYSIKIDGVTEHGGGFYLYNTTSCKVDEFETKMDKTMSLVENYTSKNNVTKAGPVFVIYHKWDGENNATIFSCCVPTTSKIITTESDILTGQIESFKAVKATLIGNYSNLKEAWESAFTYIANYNLEIDETGPMIESYVTGSPSEENPAKWITEIYIAIK